VTAATAGNQAREKWATRRALRPDELHVAVVATVIGQVEPLDRKPADLLQPLQALAQLGVDFIAGEHVLDIDALVHEREVTACAVPVIAEVGAAA